MNITLEHLTKRFPNTNKKGEEVTAISDFNIEIEDGKLVGLLGPSGCGKSTLLNMISGLEPPTEGTIHFGDRDVTEVSPEHRGVGLVFQSYALYPHLTVLGNILFPLQNLKGNQKLSKEVMNHKALEVAKLVQIEDFLSRKPSELSGGQQQRVAIARALVKMPEVLLLDEPLSNLDARLRLQTREEIRRIQKEIGITTVFVTHDQEEAMSICDSIIVMKDGIFHQSGHPQEVYDNPSNLFVAQFLGNPAINTFVGRIQNEKLFLGNDEIMATPGLQDRNVYVGIRPEGFELCDEGNLNCHLESLEVMGRDTSVVSTHSASQNKSIRSIISSESKVDVGKDSVRFNVKKNKIYLFDWETKQRIPL